MHPYRTTLHLLALTIVFSCFAGYSFMNAAWTPPPTTPPTSNTEAPVNVGTTGQVKNGGLSVNALSVIGNANVTGTSTITGIYGLNVTSAGPRIKMTNTTVGATDWWFYNNGPSFFLIADRDGNGNWTTPAENPWPMQVVASTTSTGDYALFSNKVRANEYCDRAGTECFGAADVGGLSVENLTRMPNNRDAAGVTGGPRVQISSRMIDSALDHPGHVTFYAADKDTADYLCREQYDLDYGIWTEIAQPSYAGWYPYDNLAIASFSDGAICYNGDSCYNLKTRHGRELYCYDLEIKGLPEHDTVPANKFST